MDHRLLLLLDDLSTLLGHRLRGLRDSSMESSFQEGIQLVKLGVNMSTMMRIHSWSLGKAREIGLV